jgi:antitoxin ParD1/3/4
MNISITPELEKFVADEVKTGLYQSASEVIRAGLRRLKEDKERKPGFMVSSKEELEQKILEGIAQLDRGESVTINGDEALGTFFADIKSKGRERLKKTRGQPA